MYDTSSAVSKWLRVNRSLPCPVCGRTDWCGVNSDGTVAVCMRVDVGSRGRTRNGGFVHRLAKPPAPLRRPVGRPLVAGAEPSALKSLHDLAERFIADAGDAKVAGLAADLGLEPQTLRRLEVGWAKAYDAWSFPMFDADHRVVGIRLRRPNGRKFAVRGGREGLFVPTGLPTGIPRLLVAEGPTDTAAILGLGFEAVGRSSCTGGAKLLVTLARGRRVREVVIVADADEPGRRGAESLATALLPYVDVVRVIVPPDGIKDARAWVRAGASAGDVHAAIESAAARRIRLAVASSRGEVRP